MRAVAIATGSAKAVVGGAIDPQVGVVNEVGVVHEIAYERWYRRLQKSCKEQAEQWKTTIDLLCLNQEEGHAEVGRITSHMW